MRPAALLWVDSQYFCSQSEHGVIGDSYLFFHNGLYRRTRECLVDLGFALDSGEPLASWYNAAPLLVLNEILTKKRIPFPQTSAVLAQLATSAPCLDVSEEVLLKLVKTNVTFHESLHCIGAPHVSQLVKEKVAISHELSFVITSAMVEAFANTVERLSFYQANQSLHLLFLRMNSYIGFTNETCQLLRDVVAYFGLKTVFRFGMCVLSVLNLREKDPTDNELLHIAEAACAGKVLTVAESRFLGTGTRQCWGLSKNFRDVTSRFYYKQHGAEEAYLSLLRAGPFVPPATLELFLDTADVLFAELFAGVPA